MTHPQSQANTSLAGSSCKAGASTARTKDGQPSPKQAAKPWGATWSRWSQHWPISSGPSTSDSHTTPTSYSTPPSVTHRGRSRQRPQRVANPPQRTSQGTGDLTSCRSSAKGHAPAPTHPSVQTERTPKQPPKPAPQPFKAAASKGGRTAQRTSQGTGDLTSCRSSAKGHAPAPTHPSVQTAHTPKQPPYPQTRHHRRFTPPLQV